MPTAAGVALTFDDGPDPRWTPLVLEELGRARAVATFFVLSARAAAQRPTLERIVREGHELGLHGNLHLRHDEHPAETIATDTEEALALLAPHRPRVWRPPHGIVGESTRALAARHSLRLVTWTADSVDWQAGASAAAMLASLEPQLSPGAVVLMHDAIGPGATRTTPQATVELVEPLVAAIRRRGLEPVRLDPGP